MRARKLRRISLLLIGGLGLLCLLGLALSALSNRFLPKEPERLDRLAALDKARLAEALHLRAALGERVWPGFGKMDIPVILWSRPYAFLIGLAEPPKSWEVVPGENFEGKPYFRKIEPDPQNFAVQVDGGWAAGMATKTETDAFLMQSFRNFLPPVLEQVFPYRLLILPSEVQIAGVAHESFHVLQAQAAPRRLEAAEAAHRLGERYWSADETMRADWEVEIDLLAQALRAKSPAEAADLAGQFMAQRDLRRSRARLPAELADYERQLEWEEGLAKYVEMEIWRQAFLARDYQPRPEMAADPDFKEYRTFEQRWGQELGQMRRQATQQGEVRFYLTGMAIASLLDRLQPQWKENALGEGAFLEDLLRQVLNH